MCLDLKNVSFTVIQIVPVTSAVSLHKQEASSIEGVVSFLERNINLALVGVGAKHA